MLRNQVWCCIFYRSGSHAATTPGFGRTPDNVIEIDMVENKPPRPGFYLDHALDHAVLELERLGPDGLKHWWHWPQIQDGGVLINNFSLGTLAKVALRLGEEKNDHGRFPSHQDLG